MVSHNESTPPTTTASHSPAIMARRAEVKTRERFFPEEILPGNKGICRKADKWRELSFINIVKIIDEAISRIPYSSALTFSFMIRRG